MPFESKRKLKKSGVFLLCVAPLLFAPLSIQAQSREVKRETGQWLHYYNTLVLGEHWNLLSDAGFRWREGFKEPSQYLLRSGFSYRINSRLNTGGGLAHLGNYTEGDVSRIELRPYQEFGLQNAIGFLNLRHRIRLEERFFREIPGRGTVEGESFYLRFRYSLSLQIPVWNLSGKHRERIFFLVLGDELFFNAGKRDDYTIFDQNRLFFSPTLQCNKALSIALTWAGQYEDKPGSAQYAYTQLLWLQFRHTIDLGSKPETP